MASRSITQGERDLVRVLGDLDGHENEVGGAVGFAPERDQATTRYKFILHHKLTHTTARQNATKASIGERRLF